MRLLALPALFGLLLAGCTSAPAPAAEREPPADAWGGSEEQLLVDVAALGQEFDVACQFGGGPELPRADGRVLEGTGRLRVAVTVEPGWTGLQVGHALDGGDITWLGPPLSSGRAEWLVEVAPEQAEAPMGAARWSFFAQMNLPEPATQDCYTGGGAGSYTIRIVAVRGG